MAFRKALKEKIVESLLSVAPITFIVLLLSITIAPLNPGVLLLFLFGALLLVLGMGFFTMGVDISMIPMGEGVGAEMSKAKRVMFPIIACFVLGVIVTMAEPDLQVLAEDLATIPNMIFILTVALGVGIFLMLAQLRMLLKIPLSYALVVLYAIVFALAILTPQNFIPVSFDSGGVTTGPITVPFVIALGVGLASMRNDKNSGSDSFGLVAFCSIGPILAVLILGFFYHPDTMHYAHVDVAEIETTRDAAAEFIHMFPLYMEEVTVALFPIVALFALFQLFFKRFHRTQIGRIISGLIYTFLGLDLFLTGVQVGFMPAGRIIGATIGASEYSWALVPIGLVIGFFVVRAEPAVQVLTKQVEEVSNGSISQGTIMHSLSIGVAVSIGLSMFRILTGTSILWFLVPGYVLSLTLSFFVPQIFTGIAFDSGGVASGPMTATFLLPLAMGACEALGGNIMRDAFGVVALVAMTPLIAIQVLGLWGMLQKKKAEKAAVAIPIPNVPDGIMYFD
jgi:hypothetical protein